MMRAFRRALLLSVCLFPGSLLAQSTAEALYEARLDMDGDGRMDLAVLLLNGPGRGAPGPLDAERYGLGEGESVDLNIYLANGDAKSDLTRTPDFVRKDIVDAGQTQWVQPLEVDKGALVVTSVYGWGATQTWGQSVAIVYRDGDLFVASFSKEWDWTTHLADAEVETTIGGCEVDYVAGKGVMIDENDERTPIAGRFLPVRLSDWSYAQIPAACDF